MRPPHGAQNGGPHTYSNSESDESVANQPASSPCYEVVLNKEYSGKQAVTTEARHQRSALQFKNIKIFLVMNQVP
ncbi:Hypothetical predicted protein, partial [Xyrichtys novacula]